MIKGKSENSIFFCLESKENQTKGQILFDENEYFEGTVKVMDDGKIQRVEGITFNSKTQEF